MTAVAQPTSPPRATPQTKSAGSPVQVGFLLIDDPNPPRAGAITGRVLIGQRPDNHIVIANTDVARIHAWIAATDGRHILFDTGSRAGTRVNDQRITTRHLLQDGDVIGIGETAIHYRTDPAAVAGAHPLDLTQRPPSAHRLKEGHFIDCACGAPLWIPGNFTGAKGQCRYCGQAVSIPSARATPLAKPADSPAPSRAPKTIATCGICHSPITTAEADTACPSCNLPFHADCWTENLGCSSYGCPQVNILATDDSTSPNTDQSETTEIEIDSIEDAKPPLPWEFLILASAVVGSIIGVWTFGIPALAAAIAAALGLRKNSRHQAILILALAFAAIGCIAGIALSYFWWFALKHHGVPHR